MEKLYTTAEVAEILRYSKQTVKQYMLNGKIPSIKVLGSRRVKESDLKKIIGGENSEQ